MPEHSTIQVSFIDEATGEPFAQTQMPIEQLPDEQEGMTLHMREDAFLVLSATPRTRREWREGGTLRLVLRKQQVTRMNPKDILYSLPTISEEMPALAENTTKQGKATLELHEDDWRQIEFVSLALEDAIDQELSAIERIHTQHRQGPGFTALHLRTGLPQPLAGTQLTRTELRDALGETTTWLDGISLHGADGLVEGGFAARLASGLFVYGREREGQVTVLGVQWTSRTEAVLEGETQPLWALATQRRMGLVDWCRMERMRLN